MPGCAAYCMWSVLSSLHYSVGPWKLNGSPLPPGLEQVCKAWPSGLIFKADLCQSLMARFLRSRVWRLTTCVSLDELQGRKNSHFSVCLSLWELWWQFASSRNFRPCKWKTRLINKMSLRKNWIYTSGQLSKDFRFPKLKRISGVSTEISRKRCSWGQFLTLAWGTLFHYTEIQDHHFSGDSQRFAVKRAHKTIFRLSQCCCRRCKSHIFWIGDVKNEV